MSRTHYEAKVETLEPTPANFISRADFIRFLEEYPELDMKVAREPTHNSKCGYDEIRSIGLSNSVPDRIAIRVTLTQEEIAQFTGTSRETVSRVWETSKRRDGQGSREPPGQF